MARNPEAKGPALRWGRALVALKIVGGVLGGWLASRKRGASAA